AQLAPQVDFVGDVDRCAVVVALALDAGRQQAGGGGGQRAIAVEGRVDRRIVGGLGLLHERARLVHARRRAREVAVVREGLGDQRFQRRVGIHPPPVAVPHGVVGAFLPGGRQLYGRALVVWLDRAAGEHEHQQGERPTQRRPPASSSPCRFPRGFPRCCAFRSGGGR